MPDVIPFLKGTLDILVLKALAWTPMHGFELTRWLAERSDSAFEIDEAAVYQSLYRMEAKRLVASESGGDDGLDGQLDVMLDLVAHLVLEMIAPAKREPECAENPWSCHGSRAAYALRGAVSRIVATTSAYRRQSWASRRRCSRPLAVIS